MQAHDVRSTHPRKNRKRVGRGNGSGSGTYSGRGNKGQNARSGGGVRVGFEGGQNPQIQGLPKMRGFHNPFRVAYQAVNLEKLQALPDGVTDVTPELLASYRIVRHSGRPIKILAAGDISRAFKVSATKFSSAAKAKIEAAGGSVQEA
ncbi:MAG: 50S ribosomal protein L15 [Proteobacteria bacterium]|nr:50S ribosomal protein L15 [Pseudomonadota bacterium]